MDEQDPVNEQQPAPVYRRSLPQSELDLNLMLTNTMWGSPDLSQEVKNKLRKGKIQQDEQGNMYLIKEDLWALLNIYSRDLRLANLDGGELVQVRYMLRLASDFLQCSFVEPFVVCLSEVAGILETSQSKGGFLRKQQNTFTTEQKQHLIEPPKKTLWGTTKTEAQ